MMTRKKLLVFVLLIVVLMVGVFIITRDSKFVNYKIAIPESNVKSGLEDVIYSNGRRFIKYNVVSGKTKPLGKEVGLPTDIQAIQISDNGRFLLFIAEKQYANDLLGQTLTKEKLYTQQPYFWVYDIEKDSYKHLPENISTAVFYDSSIVSISKYYDHNTDNGYVFWLDKYSPENLKQLSRVSTEEIVQLYSNSTGVYGFARSGDFSLVNVSTGATSAVSNSITPITLSRTHEYATAITPQKKGFAAGVMDLKSKKFHKITDSNGEDANMIWSFDDNGVLFSKNKTTFGAKKVAKNGFSGNIRFKADRSIANLYPVLSFSKNLLMTTDGISIFIASDRPVVVPKYPKEYRETVNGNIYITFNEDTNSFLVSILGDIDTTTKNTVYDKISRDGYDPNLYVIEFKTIPRDGKINSR